MNLHKHARLTPHGRALLVRRILHEGLRVEEAAQACGVSARTAYKWLDRFRQQGPAGLADRSSRPERSPHATPEPVVMQVLARRRERQTYRHIGDALGLGQSTVARIVRRAGLNRLSALEPPRAQNRYEHPNPGDMLHLDIKKLGRFRRPGHRVTGDRTQSSDGAGWEYVHVAIDDNSRVAFSCIQKDERAMSAVHALIETLRYYRTLGVSFRQVLTDNGACYRSALFARAMRRLGLKHHRTRPYTPRTNGKAERFIQTSLREWAYARSYDSSDQRATELTSWLHTYNWHRPHASLDYKPPISRIPMNVNNVLALHS